MVAQLARRRHQADALGDIAPEGGSAFVRNVSALLERTEYRRCDAGEDLEDIYRLRYKAYRLHGFLSDSSDQMMSDALDDAPNCHRFGVFVDGQLVSTVRMHHVTEAEPYGPVMTAFEDLVGPRLLRGESFINTTLLAGDPDYLPTQRALPYLTLRLGLVASVFFEATSCIGVVRGEHTAFYRRVFGAVQVGQPRPYPPFTVPVMLYDANCAANRDWIVRRFPFFKSTQVEQRMLFAKLDRGELAPLTVLPTAKYLHTAA